MYMIGYAIYKYCGSMINTSPNLELTVTTTIVYDTRRRNQDGHRSVWLAHIVMGKAASCFGVTTSNISIHWFSTAAYCV